MASGNHWIQQLDSQLDRAFADWNIFSTLLALALVTYLLYPIFFAPDPDTHPLLLARQAAASYVRQPGESAILRSLETPHGYPLRTGLNVKDPDAQKWMSGRDGDLRDVWKQATRGPLDADGKELGTPSKVLTVFGKEEIIELGFDKLTREINTLGNFLKAQGGFRIAIYLPSSVEFLVTLFAAAFYGFTPILVPQRRTPEELADILNQTQANVLVAAAGTIPLKELLKHCYCLKQVIWVVERASRHMDWNEVPDAIGGEAEIIVWHDIMDEKNEHISSDVPDNVPDMLPPNIIIPTKTVSAGNETFEIIEFTQKNIVAAIAAQISVMPKPHRLGPADLVLSLEPLSNIWGLTMTLVALFSNSSLALTSSAGSGVKYGLVTQAVSPTIVVASAETMSQACKENIMAAKGLSTKFKFWKHARSLASGIMPKSSDAGAFVRIIYISNDATADTPPLDSVELFDLKVTTGARQIYALTDANVAGAIAQTNIFDYEDRTDGLSKYSHFGPPLSSVEIYLEENDRKIDDEKPTGCLVINGPAVVGGKTKVHRMMTFTDSNTLCYSS